METNPTCSKCGGAMEEGFIPDQSEINQLSYWHPDKPEREHLLGITMATAKVNKKRLMPIAAYRCTQCGFLESYAP